MATIDELIFVPLQTVIGDIFSAVPGLVYAILIIFIGWLVSLIISNLFKKLLKKVLKLDNFLKKHDLHDAMGDMKLSNILPTLVYWWIFLIFLGQAAMQLSLGMISTILTGFIAWTPNLFYAILLLIGGFFFADFVTDKIKKSENIWADRIGMVLEPVIVSFVALIAIGQLGIDVSLIVDLIKILFLMLSFGVALAIGLAFGLGMKDEAPKMWKNIQKEWNKKRK